MLTCEGLTKSFDKPLFQDLAINLGPGQIMAILGPSGCGKTTLLRCICGLEELDQGSILLHGADVTGTPPEDRGIGMIFQEPVLYPHLSVSGNLSLASESGHEAALEEVGLGGFGDRSVETLSGGEGQRVALARALLAEPSVLLRGHKRRIRTDPGKSVCNVMCAGQPAVHCRARTALATFSHMFSLGTHAIEPSRIGEPS